MCCLQRARCNPTGSLVSMNIAVVSSGFVPTVRDLVSLTKPRVSALVLATSAAGIGLAPGSIAPSAVVAMLVGMLLCVGSANSLNCFIERESDKLMTRTRARALPAGRLDPKVALWFGLSLGVLSIPLLTAGVNAITGMLGAIALFSYVAIYTPLKTRSPLSLIVGAVPGALPPLMGYTAVTGRIEAPGVLLFALLFLWQIPHVIGLASFRREEYVAAGIRVLPAVYGERTSKLHAVVWALVLLLVSLIPLYTGDAGVLYFVAALLLGGAYLGATLRGFVRVDLALWGRRVFLTSLFYLPLLFLALLLDGRV
jgi:protoheme IX farnesyltransferase